MRKLLTYSVREVAPYINWLYFFHAWGMEPRFAAVAEVHDCPACRAGWVASFDASERAKAQEAVNLYQEAMELLRQWADAPICHALFLLADAYSDGDDIIVNGQVRIPFLRQQHAGKSGYTLCLSDFVQEASPLSSSEDGGAADIANRIGIFAATVSQPTLNSEALGLSKNPQPSSFNPQPSTINHQPSSIIPQPSTIIHHPPSLIHSLLADRLAEATAEKMHEEVRKHYWGYAKDEQLTMAELHAERFQGIRPAVGYPSLPDQSINFLIDELLHFENICIGLSENGAMTPHSSVSGFMFAHPRAQYFSVGTIGEDQLRDYSSRRGLSAEKLRNFLVSNL